MASKPAVHDLISLFEAIETSESKMDEHTRYLSQLLPSPWTEMAPSLTIPYSPRSTVGSEVDSDRPSPLTSATSSPASSPTSSPISASPRMNRFTSSLRRIGSRSKKCYSSSSLGMGTILLRRRPSNVDLALTEERYRCTEDSIERRGLGLLEPRPVDPMPLMADGHAHIDSSNNLSSVTSDLKEPSALLSPLSARQSPRFVMGGIAEVMEGSA
ncbi:hypothetical protein TRV_01915 [Trichophyton verrucosum HKI 0517]|uniref:Uncharacterized protein n=1 Tax=Trichophyton verrucosum (strain HKI 0517) TaxID=663202 RepID=D4D4A0_TRIVH|nr:uncharacterized protein TRV_01915 [Trichophyton verrucosum HKI 0517]EFE43355.1 hypothetical protein TRV_01915 [Trichophyton verrucosum HKI 0517]